MGDYLAAERMDAESENRMTTETDAPGLPDELYLCRTGGKIVQAGYPYECAIKYTRQSPAPVAVEGLDLGDAWYRTEGGEPCISFSSEESRDAFMKAARSYRALYVKDGE